MGQKETHVSRKSHHRRKRIRAIISVLFSFLLAMILTVLFAVIALQFGFFNKGMTLNKINESGYYTKVYEELIHNLDIILESKELPKELLNDIVTERNVYINGKQYIENSLNNKDTKVSVDKIDSELTDAMTAYYEGHNITIDDNVKGQMQSVIQSINSEYTRMIRFQFVHYIRTYKQAVYHVYAWLLPVLLICGALLIVALLKMHRYIHRGVRYIAFAAFSAGGINLILPVFMLIQKKYAKLGMTPDYYNVFMGDYVKLSLTSFMYVGLIGMICGLVLIIGVRILKNRI